MGSPLAKTKWDSDAHGPLCESAIRALFQPPENYRISVQVLAPGAKTGGAGRAGLCYVLSGSVAYRFGPEAISLAAGDLASLPEGTYSIEVLENGATLVRVWDLGDIVGR